MKRVDIMPDLTEHGHNSPKRTAGNDYAEQEEIIDLRDIFMRLGRGLRQIVGLALLGLVAAAVTDLVVSRSEPVATSARVVFSFPGIGKGQYPDGSKFRPDDLLAPDIVANALQNQGLDISGNSIAGMRSALTVEGIIPVDVVKARDRLQALGQAASPYVPDEYALTLTLPRSFPLNNRQRGILINSIIGAFRDKFEATYVEVPGTFGTALDALKGADFSEFEQILVPDVQNLIDYLKAQIDQAKDFRSRTTNLSFSDLLDRAQILSEIRVNEILGLIRQNGLSSDRNLALTRIEYGLQTLDDQERSAIEEEKVIGALLSEARDRVQSYVLGVKSQAARPEGPFLDQGLIDSLLANDSYNFLVRRDLDAGLAVKHIQAEESRLLERRKYLEALSPGTHVNSATVLAQVQKSLIDMEKAYGSLIADVRDTQRDFGQQRFADAISLSQSPSTIGILRPLEIYSAGGLFLGAALGMALSLLGVYMGEKRT